MVHDLSSRAGEPLAGIEPLRPLLAHRPLGFVSDIDGTLAPIAPRPEDARVSPVCRARLQELMAAGVKVAFVTGRDLDVARGMTGMENAAYAVNHGLTLWVDGREETPEGVREYVPLARQVVAEIGGVDVPGVLIEEKGPVLAFHYRQAADEKVAQRAILSAIGVSPSAGTFRIHEGRKVIEMRPPLAIDKGTALEEIVARLGLGAVICVGDDATDIDMFRTVTRLREGGLPGASVAVVSGEATAEVMAAADYTVDGVEGVEWLLSAVLKALRETRP